MVDYSRDSEFRREWEYQYLQSVYVATAAAYERAAYQPADVAYVALASELRKRGVHPDPDAVFSGAALISRGEQPPILRPGRGRRRRDDASLATRGSRAGRSAAPRPE
jgi:hypothetical protein